MRKFIKYSLIVVLLMALAGGGAFYYFAKVKTYDVADEQVDVIIEDPYSIAFPEGTPLPEGVQKDEEGLVIVDKEGSFILEDGTVITSDEWFSSAEYTAASAGASAPAGNAGTSGGSSSGGSGAADSTGDAPSGGNKSNASNPNGNSSSDSRTGGTNTGGNPGSAGSAAPERVTAATIKQRYASSFDSLQGQVEGQLGSLIGQAKEEYTAKKAAGETINPAYFYQKYNGAAQSVEAKTDSAFNSLYNAMKSELSANGLSTSAAEEYKQQYEAAKEARKSELLSKVTGG